VSVAVRLDPAVEAVPAVEYRWDEDTDILTASVAVIGDGEGMSGSVGVEGSDGSWLIFDVAGGSIRGVEVAVWPEVKKRTVLAPPSDIEPATVRLPSTSAKSTIAALETDTTLMAEADREERTIHFRIGKRRPVRTVRLAREILLEVDARDYLAGVWLLNVPPSPALS
jgi:hypothetical protein